MIPVQDKAGTLIDALAYIVGWIKRDAGTITLGSPILKFPV
jgi:hypothetical protein